jgi:hypothetical protein
VGSAGTERPAQSPRSGPWTISVCVG